MATEAETRQDPDLPLKPGGKRLTVSPEVTLRPAEDTVLVTGLTLSSVTRGDTEACCTQSVKLSPLWLLEEAPFSVHRKHSIELTIYSA